MPLPTAPTSPIRFEKAIAALPAVLTPNTVYVVRAGAGVDIYVSDLTGAIAYKTNSAGYSSASSPPSDANIWFNSEEGRLYVKYNGTWVEANPTQIDPTAIRFNDEGKIEFPSGTDFGGSYNELADKPVIPDEQIQSNWTQTDTNLKDYIRNKPTFASIATSGLYSDLSGAPVLADVATSGSYLDLNHKPDIPLPNTVSKIDAEGGVTDVLTNISTFRFNVDAGFSIDDLGDGAIKIGAAPTFKTWSVFGQEDLVPTGLDTIQFVGGGGISITTDPHGAPNKTITFTGLTLSVSGNDNIQKPIEPGSNISFTGTNGINITTDDNGNLTFEGGSFDIVTIQSASPTNEYTFRIKGLYDDVEYFGDQWAFTTSGVSGQNNITSLTGTGAQYAPFTTSSQNLNIQVGLVGDEATYNFTNTGITFPDGSVQVVGFEGNKLFYNDGIANNTVTLDPTGTTIRTRGVGYDYNWSFNDTGGLVFPDYTIQTTAWTGTVDWENINNKPPIPADVSDLTDTTGLLFSKDYNDLTNLPTLFDGNYNSLSNLPDLSGYATLTGEETLTNKTLTSPTITDGVFQDSFTIGNQVFYDHGYNGFSVNEDFDIVGESNFTGYHYTSGAGRDGVAFTLARTGQFTDGFGITGDASNNQFVIGGEAGNTDFLFKTGIGMPFDVSGGTTIFTISRDGSLTFADETTQTTAWTGSIDWANVNNQPTIPAAQIQSDWTQTNNVSLDYIKNKPTFATVATSGSYTDLSNTPTYYYAADDLLPKTASPGGTVKFLGTNGITTTSDNSGNISIRNNVNSFSSFIVTGYDNVVASSPNQSVEFIAGNGIELFPSAENNSITITSNGGQGSAGTEGIIKTFNLLGEFWAPVAGTSSYFVNSPTVLRSVTLTNGGVVRQDLMVGLYRNGGLIGFYTLPSGFQNISINTETTTLYANDNVTVSVVSGSGINFSLILSTNVR
jgi:hypothetical protein